MQANEITPRELLMAFTEGIIDIHEYISMMRLMVHTVEDRQWEARRG